MFEKRGRKRAPGGKDADGEKKKGKMNEK